VPCLTSLNLNLVLSLFNETLQVYLHDGAICLDVMDVEAGKVVRAVARNGGTLGERKVVNIQGVQVHSKMSSMQDLADIQSFA
jgi:pyruvate kinase